MLRRIQIRDLAIIEQLEIAFETGMTVITGETGAGKSIIMEALDVALGDRADSKMIRHGATRCEITLEFDISAISSAQAWLRNTDLLEGTLCLVRRVINQDGRSRNYINGSLVTVQQLRDLSQRLVHIHSQHQHQALTKREEQRQLLDFYAGHTLLLTTLAEQYEVWHTIKLAIEKIKCLPQQGAEIALLRYHFEELEQAHLLENEVESLHREHKQLMNADNLRHESEVALMTLVDGDGFTALSVVNEIANSLKKLKELGANLDNAQSLIENALIQLTEAEDEIRAFHSEVRPDQHRLQEVEQRLNTLHNLARKHKLPAEQLPEYFIRLKQQLEEIDDSHSRLNELMKQEKTLLDTYHQTAKQLYVHRQQAAKKLNQRVTDNMHQLGMTGGQFAIQVTHEENASPTAYGLDKIEFLVSANPGQPLQALAKVASGGELSRISLAIQVITAQAVSTPSLLFDEVDVGIGGSTAAIVGKLLRQLGHHAQVICITHLPQVAAQGQRHLRIHKAVSHGQTHAEVTVLDEQARVEEIARMLGGIKITSQSLAHAEEMLAEV